MALKDVADQTAALPSLVGGVLWGLARIVTVLFAPVPPSKRDIWKAAVEASCSAAAGGAGGLYVAPAICHYMHVSDIEGVSAIAVFFGLGFWQLVPLIVAAITKITSLKLGMATPEKIDGVGK